MTRVLLPTTIVETEGPVVFLAGPIQGAPDWQAAAIEWFATHNSALCVASPRRLDRSSDFLYSAQVD